MRKNRLDELERQVTRLTNAVNELQARLDFLQNSVNTSTNVEPLRSLSLRKVSADYTTKEVDVKKMEISKTIARTFKEVLKGPEKGITSEQVACATGRSRTVESSYLHKLFESGYLKRKRIGRNVYYSRCNG